MTEFKVGDRVRIRDHATGLASRHRGEVHSIVALIGDGGVRVVSGSEHMVLWAHEFERADPLTTLNGLTYTLSTNTDGTLTLTPVQEQKPDFEQGQIWRVPLGYGAIGYRYFLILSNDKFTDLDGLLMKHTPSQLREGGEFIAASLADALEQGLLKPADLR